MVEFTYILHFMFDFSLFVILYVNRFWAFRPRKLKSCFSSTYFFFKVLGARDILINIRIFFLLKQSA